MGFPGLIKIMVPICDTRGKIPGAAVRNNGVVKGVVPYAACMLCTIQNLASCRQKIIPSLTMEMQPVLHC